MLANGVAELSMSRRDIVETQRPEIHGIATPCEPAAALLAFPSIPGVWRQLAISRVQPSGSENNNVPLGWPAATPGRSR